jgi:hypothetical protein
MVPSMAAQKAHRVRAAVLSIAWKPTWTRMVQNLSSEMIVTAALSKTVTEHSLARVQELWMPQSTTLIRMLRRTPILSFARTPDVDVPNLERGSGLYITWNGTWTRMREAWPYRSPSRDAHKPLALTLDTGISPPLSSV